MTPMLLVAFDALLMSTKADLLTPSMYDYKGPVGLFRGEKVFNSLLDTLPVSTDQRTTMNPQRCNTILYAIE